MGQAADLRRVVERGAADATGTQPTASAITRTRPMRLHEAGFDDESTTSCRCMGLRSTSHERATSHAAATRARLLDLRALVRDRGTRVEDTPAAAFRGGRNMSLLTRIGRIATVRPTEEQA